MTALLTTLAAVALVVGFVVLRAVLSVATSLRRLADTADLRLQREMYTDDLLRPPGGVDRRRSGWRE